MVTTKFKNELNWSKMTALLEYIDLNVKIMFSSYVATFHDKILTKIYIFLVSTV